MTDKQRQVTADVVKALARHGPWGAVVAVLLLMLMNPQIMAAALEGVTGSADKKIESAKAQAVAEAKSYVDEKTNAVIHDVASIKERLASLDAKLAAVDVTVKESLKEQRDTNRQVGELVGELRAIRRTP